MTRRRASAEGTGRSSITAAGSTGSESTASGPGEEVSIEAGSMDWIVCRRLVVALHKREGLGLGLGLARSASSHTMVTKLVAGGVAATSGMLRLGDIVDGLNGTQVLVNSVQDGEWQRLNGMAKHGKAEPEMRYSPDHWVQ